MQGEQLVPGSLGVAVHVDQDVNAVLVDAVGCLAVAGNLEQTGWECLLLDISDNKAWTEVTVGGTVYL